MRSDLAERLRVGLQVHYNLRKWLDCNISPQVAQCTRIIYGGHHLLSDISHSKTLPCFSLNIIQPCDSVPWPWNMSIMIFCGLIHLNEVKYFFTIYTFKLTLGKFGWSSTPNTVHRMHILSRCFSLHLFYIYHLNNDTIHTNTNHYPYRHQFLPIFQLSSHEGKIMGVPAHHQRAPLDPLLPG